ncbi:MAG: hypothetical protein OHK0046_21750 [Anaerolineae bacterium]
MAAHLEYEELHNHIHYFQVTKLTPRAIDEGLSYFTQFQETSSSAVLCLVDYLAQDPPPISILLQKLTQWLRQHPHHRPIYLVLLSDNHLAMCLIENAFKMLPQNRFSLVAMRPDQKEVALEYLLHKRYSVG